jgi:hypothetical protein
MQISCTITLAYPDWYSRTCHTALRKAIHTSGIAASVFKYCMPSAQRPFGMTVPGSAGVCPVFVQHVPECYISSVGLTSRTSAISRVFSLLLTTVWCHGRRAASPKRSRLPVPSSDYWTSKRWEDFNSSASLRHHRESRDL